MVRLGRSEKGRPRGEARRGRRNGRSRHSVGATVDPADKGRTFNRMINNGSKGGISRGPGTHPTWRGIDPIRIPSFYTSSTDWRNGSFSNRPHEATALQETGFKQPPRIRIVGRAGPQIAFQKFVDETTVLHHKGAIAHVRDHGKIMTDEHKC